MRRILILTAVFLPQPAAAHVGHLGDLAGHSHWIALGAVGIATVVGALGAAKDRKKAAGTPEEEEDDAEPDADAQGASA